MISLKNQYLKLFDKAQGKALDPTRGTIYTFEKYCLCCGQGMQRPAQWDKKTKKKLFRVSFCTDICKDKGERFTGSFAVKAGSSDVGRRDVYPVEELAFVAVELKREQEAMNPIKRLVYMARQNFNLLSESLSFLEAETGDRWSESKMYYWYNKK